MIENHKDIDRTRHAKALGIFLDPRSYYNIAGHVFLRGKDRSRQRLRAWIKAKSICAICGRSVHSFDADYDHQVGGSKHRRCDCLDQELNNGEMHTNVRMVHGMFSKEPCHRQKHHRE